MEIIIGRLMEKSSLPTGITPILFSCMGDSFFTLFSAGFAMMFLTL